MASGSLRIRRALRLLLPIGRGLRFPVSKESSKTPGHHLAARRKRLSISLGKTRTTEVAFAKAGLNGMLEAG